MAGSDCFEWLYQSTAVSHTNLQKMIDRGCVNLVKNSSFESWSQGTNVAPDAWAWTTGGGTITRTATSASYKGEGTYCAKLSNNTTAAQLTQTLTPIFGANSVKNMTFSVSAEMFCTEANKAQLLFYDGVSTQYSTSYASNSSWGTVAEKFTTNASSANAIKVGIRIAGHSSAIDTYVDNIQVVRGDMVPAYTQSPADYCPALDGYFTDSTWYDAKGGALRVIPFTWSWIHSTPAQTVTTSQVTFPANHEPKSIRVVTCGLYSVTGSPTYDYYICGSNNYLTGPARFTLYVAHRDGTTLGTGVTFTIKGVVYAHGWDDAEYVFGE